jgi:endonuclease YncB( thermonuclease family)
MRKAVLVVITIVSSAGEASADILTGGPALAVDGGTLVFSTYTVNLAGVIALDREQGCTEPSTYREGRCGLMAAIALQNLVAGQNVHCQGDLDIGSKHLVAACSTGATPDLGRAMIEAGWAMADPRSGDDYEAAQAKARAAKIGMWSFNFDLPWQWRADQAPK